MYRGKTHEGFYNKKVHPSYVKNAYYTKFCESLKTQEFDFKKLLML